MLNFEAIDPAFYDPGALFEHNGTVDREDRLQIIGMAKEATVYAVFTSRGEDTQYETYRIISARKASNGERKRYAKATQ